MTSPGGVGAARGDAPTPQDAATDWLDAIQAAEIKAGLDWTLENAHPLLMSVGPLVAALRRVEALADKWANTTDSLTGQRSLVTWAFAMEVRAAIAHAARPVPVAADVPTPSAATQNDEAQR